MSGVDVSADQQAMHEALAILGFDITDPTPAAQIAGGGSDRFRAYFLDCIREERRDHEALLDELP